MTTAANRASYVAFWHEVTHALILGAVLPVISFRATEFNLGQSCGLGRAGYLVFRKPEADCDISSTKPLLRTFAGRSSGQPSGTYRWITLSRNVLVTLLRMLADRTIRPPRVPIVWQDIRDQIRT